MGKNKLKKFAELSTFNNVIQPNIRENFVADHEFKGKWNELFFKNTNPIVLELGCGKGEYTVGLAKQFPDKNYIGIDIKGARIHKGAKAAIDNCYANVAFIRTKIDAITSYFSENEIDEIWITFPDPQPKKQEKRLTSATFLNRYKQILKAGNFIHLKTDSYELYSYTLQLLEHNHIPIVEKTDNLYQSDIEGAVKQIKTFYEQQFLNKGKKINYLKFTIFGGQLLHETKHFSANYLLVSKK